MYLGFGDLCIEFRFIYYLWVLCLVLNVYLFMRMSEKLELEYLVCVGEIVR